jgi:hypothetical protein
MSFKHEKMTEHRDGTKVFACSSLCAACAIEMAVRLERERCAKIAETEEELPGDPSAYILSEMERIGPVENARAAVRSTKASIARRIRGAQTR